MGSARPRLQNNPFVALDSNSSPADRSGTIDAKRRRGTALEAGVFEMRPVQYTAVAASSAAAEARAKGLNDMQPKDNPEAWRGGVYSSGSVVFSIALFQRAATASTATQLEKLVAAAKQRLPK